METTHRREPSPKGEALTQERRKQSLHFPEDMLEEIRQEAQRLERTFSWVVQRAWKLAKRDIQSISSDPGP